MTARIFPTFVLTAFVLAACIQAGTEVRGAAGLPAHASAGYAKAAALAGRALFLKNCAHCHGADARGDEGPDLHNLDWPAEKIAAQIRGGRKGKMTAFAGKLQPPDVDALVAYVQTLK